MPFSSRSTKRNRIDNPAAVPDCLTYELFDMEKSLTFRNSLKNTAKRYYRHRLLFLMLLPVILHFFIFKYLPIYGLAMAFQDFYPLKGVRGSEWVGFKHFRQVFQGLYFLPVLRNTMAVSLYKLFWGFPAPIILALMLNEVHHAGFKKSIQTITYLPHFVSWVVLAGLVIEMLSPSRGPVNWAIKALGGEPIFFVGSEKWFRTVLVGSSIWKSVGWSSIIYLAAIAGIDPGLYEAATIDGAGRFRQMISITLPSLAPVIMILFIFRIGSIINDDFEQILNLLNANVLSVGDVITTYTFREGLQKMNYSYAAAVGFFKNAVSFTMVFGANLLARKYSDHSIW